MKQETVSGSGISWAICKSAPRSRQITMPAPHYSVFLQAGCPSCRPTNSVKALKAQLQDSTEQQIRTCKLTHLQVYSRHTTQTWISLTKMLWSYCKHTYITATLPSYIIFWDTEKNEWLQLSVKMCILRELCFITMYMIITFPLYLVKHTVFFI